MRVRQTQRSGKHIQHLKLQKCSVARTNYTTDDRFQFPWKTGTSATLEAEFATTITEACGATQWRCEIGTGDWASNGKFINSLNKTNTGTDKVEYAYNAKTRYISRGCNLS